MIAAHAVAGAGASAVRRVAPGIVAAVVLLLAYAGTLAPDVTFWDAGEFIAAAHSLGIPHPPGTPLYILLLHVWGKLFFFLPYAVATNLFSAASTALAAALLGRLVHRWTGSWHMAVAAAIASGSMSSVWLNATETEVYAASLALGTLMLWAGDRAGREDRERYVHLLAYLMVLAVPLHLSALVAAPAAGVLAAHRADRVDWRRACLLLGAFVIAMGAGRVSVATIVAGIVIVTASAFVGRKARLPARIGWAGTVIAASVVAASALAFLYYRAKLDPSINQGNPDSWMDLQRVVARRQYAVSPLWPRQAPIWIQVANFGQYADWQVALSLGPTVLPSLLRTLGTLAFIVLGGEGLWHHFRTDRRAATAWLVLLLCGSLGVVAYLNMRAGPSIGYGILPEGTFREARERDYFYVFAFWAWGAWAGIGAIVMARSWKRPAWTGLLLAALPLVLNWRAVTRRGEPEQTLPRAVAESILGATPPNGVLLVAGDNDSYPLWYAQEVLGYRRDVTVVTIPLLPTRWYRDEMMRRHGLLTLEEASRYEPMFGTVRLLADGAARANRPLVASISLTAEERGMIDHPWQAAGMVFVRGAEGIDTTATARWARWVRDQLPDTATREAIDPIASYFRRALECPRQLSAFAATADSTQLDSVCNYR
ncbi:MAG TPA: DUF2723 domain-containing protein [Gemmatimonadaceae bacterium]|nr:DUF2723 domain-containing protein [Gemmatimonadaceae bacterium]